VVGAISEKLASATETPKAKQKSKSEKKQAAQEKFIEVQFPARSRINDYGFALMKKDQA
jgi:hypothetical protein